MALLFLSCSTLRAYHLIPTDDFHRFTRRSTVHKSTFPLFQEYTIDGLETYTQYLVSLKVFNPEGNGPETIVVVMTDEGGPADEDLKPDGSPPKLREISVSTGGNQVKESSLKEVRSTEWMEEGSEREDERAFGSILSLSLSEW
eukprot:TCALIF_08244-PA protein Name:"Protein of unknown function" AED:0.77 eAED:0.79 QI:0/0/0/0.5/1/1/2/0/143